MNTRTFPRTLNQAFPRTAEYGAAIERPAPMFARSRAASSSVGWGLAIAATVVALILIGGY